MQVEVPLELVAVVAVLPGVCMLLNAVFGSCFLTAQLFGVDDCQRSRRRGGLAVRCIMGLGVWQYLTYVGGILPLQPGPVVWKALVYHVLLALWAHCYRGAVCRTSVAPQLAQSAKEVCKKCDRSRPPGTHHCRECGVCVLDQDHHCIFINNCVARHNRKLFVLTTLYTVLIAAELLLDLCLPVATALTAFSWSWREYNVVLGTLATLVIGLGALGLFLVQVCTIPLGMTTIDVVAWLPCTRRQGKEFQYKGFSWSQKLANVQKVMGPTPLHWALPL
mmetsp:Transcript_63770/g.113883  ORF Transcript_63770/g.113883 Transcript_63770/m.113883 type:complete len:277 (-) Transcript_63770:365-1195(-)